MKETSEAEIVLRTAKPDGGYGWIVCCGTFIVNFVVFGIHNSFGVVYVNLLDDLKLGEMQTGKRSWGKLPYKMQAIIKLKLTCTEDHDQSSSRNEKVYPGNIHCAFAQRIITQSELLRGTNVFFFVANWIYQA